MVATVSAISDFGGITRSRNTTVGQSDVKLGTFAAGHTSADSTIHCSVSVGINGTAHYLAARGSQYQYTVERCIGAGFVQTIIFVAGNNIVTLELIAAIFLQIHRKVVLNRHRHATGLISILTAVYAEENAIIHTFKSFFCRNCSGKCCTELHCTIIPHNSNASTFNRFNAFKRQFETVSVFHDCTLIQNVLHVGCFIEAEVHCSFINSNNQIFKRSNHCIGKIDVICVTRVTFNSRCRSRSGKGDHAIIKREIQRFSFCACQLVASAAQIDDFAGHSFVISICKGESHCLSVHIQHRRKRACDGRPCSIHDICAADNGGHIDDLFTGHSKLQKCFAAVCRGEGRGGRTEPELRGKLEAAILFHHKGRYVRAGIHGFAVYDIVNHGVLTSFSREYNTRTFFIG